MHVANTVLLYLFIMGIVKNKTGAFLGSLLFAVHPVHAEAINCITYNEDLLTMFFGLKPILLYLQWNTLEFRHKKLAYGDSLVAAFLGMLSKEMGVTAPIVLVLMYWLSMRYSNKVEEDVQVTRRKNIMRYGGYVLVSFFYLFLYFVVFQNPDKSPVVSKGSLFEQIIYLPHIIMHDFQTLVYPVNLNPDYQYSYPLSFFELLNLVAVAI